MRLEQIGLVGNCQCAALIDCHGAVVWCCLPRFDAEPVFSTLLDAAGGGHFTIAPADGQPGIQRYLENTNILETHFDTPDGAFRVIDFMPRFPLFERMFRPTKLVRIVEPLRGTPQIRVTCSPRLGWSKAAPTVETGSHHVSYKGFASELRLTTNMPLSYLGHRSFALTERKHFVLAWGAPVEEPLEALCHRFLRETTAYWRGWVKGCDVPAHYQEQVIRSALALKLHCFEDTGAIVASLTMALPESPASGRTWDYRYCWLRDAYYALGAFRLLGQFDEREGFLHFLLDVASRTPTLDLAPLYRIDGGTDLSERILPDWPGFRGEGPVRIGNQAAEHQQNDVFGEMVLALTPLFLDQRFRDQRSPRILELMKQLARKAISVAGKPDAGIWEYRSGWRPQTFSTLMCWAGADRMARIARAHCPELEPEFVTGAERLRQEILARGVDPARGTLVATYDGVDVDAALLQAITLGLLPAADPRMSATVEAIRVDLATGSWLRRYRTHDDLGVPTVAFLICTFWLVEALAALGRLEEARRLMTQLTTTGPPLGLMAENIDPTTGELWGNYPQAYSHVGMIHAAFAASPPWSAVL
jgi:GH15 family glucan-1,4-alpha-glucosidase